MFRCVMRTAIRSGGDFYNVRVPNFPDVGVALEQRATIMRSLSGAPGFVYGGTAVTHARVVRKQLRTISVGDERAVAADVVHVTVQVHQADGASDPRWGFVGQSEADILEYMHAVVAHHMHQHPV